jgi:hypothetical protein
MLLMNLILHRNERRVAQSLRLGCLGIGLTVILPLLAGYSAYAKLGDDESFEAVVLPHLSLYLEKSLAPTQEQRNLLAQESEKIVNEVDRETAALFSEVGSSADAVRVLTPDSFHGETGAPPWIAALFRPGNITIALTGTAGNELWDFRRNLRHEYTHALIVHNAGLHCPAWFDEGIAQLVEGKPSAALVRALKSSIIKHPAISLSSLNEGFTELDSSLVPAAYAQSLFAVSFLLSEYEPSQLRTFLQKLKSGEEASQAFEAAFRISLAAFEGGLNNRGRQWVEANEEMFPISASDHQRLATVRTSGN